MPSSCASWAPPPAEPALRIAETAHTGKDRVAKPEERNGVVSDRFDRFLPLAGVLAGLLFFVGLVFCGTIRPARRGQPRPLLIGRTTEASTRSLLTWSHP